MYLWLCHWVEVHMQCKLRTKSQVPHVCTIYCGNIVYWAVWMTLTVPSHGSQDMLCFSGGGILSIKASNFPVHQQRQQVLGLA